MTALYRYLTWDELNELATSPLITIGAHTHSHVALTRLDPKEAHGEIMQCQKLLMKNLGHSIQHFAYPYGDTNRRVRSMVHEAGFTSAMTTEPWGVDSHCDRLMLPRLEIHENEPLPACCHPAS